MSVWTHVAGVVRIDAIRVLEESPNFDMLFGKEWTFDDMWDDEPAYTEFESVPEKYMPSGSEGSLQKSVWVNPDEHSMASYVVTIFGDLRDYDTPESIISWFKDCCDVVWVRQGIITVETEGREPIVYKYTRNDGDDDDV